MSARRLMSIIATVWWAGLAAGQEGRNCFVCQVPLQGPFYMMTSPMLPEPVPVCQDCTRIQRFCSECNLPVKIGFQTLPDGRFLCQPHAQTAVFAASEAETLFKEVRRDLLRLFAGTGRLPDQNVTIQLVDRRELRRLLAGKPWINAEIAVGITETVRAGNGLMRHQIYVLNGLTRAHFAAVAAHEYGHTWAAENVTRRLQAKTLEGFCELVAYNLMTERREETQKKVILANAYTEGQTEIFRQAEHRYQFHRVTDWMKRGEDEAIGQDDPTRVLALRTSPQSRAPFYPEAKTPVPDQLELRGISGSAQRRFALVNDCTLEKNEQAKVRVGRTNVIVRCLDITERSVVLRLAPTGQIRELWLRTDH